MKKLTTLSTILVASALFSNVVLAKSAPWDRMSASYISLDIEDADGFEPTGFGLSGSKLLNENIFVDGGFDTVSDEVDVFGINVDVALSTLTLGLGYRYGVTETTDIFATVSYISLEVESSYGNVSISEDDNGHDIALGFRSMLTDQFELFGKIASTSIDGESENSFGGGVNYYFNDQVSTGLGYIKGDDASTTQVILTYNF